LLLLYARRARWRATPWLLSGYEKMMLRAAMLISISSHYAAPRHGFR